MPLHPDPVDIRATVARLRARDLATDRRATAAQVDRYVTRRTVITRRRERTAVAFDRVAMAIVVVLGLWITIPVATALIARSM